METEKKYYESRRKASSKYIKEKVKRILVSFSPLDYELLDWVKSKGPTATVIKDILRKEKAKEDV